MGSGIWLQLLLTLSAFWGIRAKESLLGILGAPTLLQIPAELQERTKEFGEVSWKKTMEGAQKKKILVKISGGNVTEYERERMRFHEGNFSLEILNSSREDEGLYEFSASQGPEEELQQIQLRVLEPVSHPSIRILQREWSNGSCSLSLLCSSERGDEVSYSWSSRDNGTSTGICSGSGRLLNVSFSLRGSRPLRCLCTAWNAVSSRDAAFQASHCGTESGGVPRVGTELLALLVALGIIVIIVIIVIVTFRATRSATRDQDPPQVTPDGATSATIYAQVQKPRGVPIPFSCTTIYAAATGPPPATGPSPATGPPPAESPAPRGHRQEPTTVYASVTLPMA